MGDTNAAIVQRRRWTAVQEKELVDDEVYPLRELW